MEAITHAPATATATFPTFSDLNDNPDGNFGRTDGEDGFGSTMSAAAAATPTLATSSNLPSAVVESAPVAQSLSPSVKTEIETSHSSGVSANVEAMTKQMEQQHVSQPNVEEGTHQPLPQPQSEEGTLQLTSQPLGEEGSFQPIPQPLVEETTQQPQPPPVPESAAQPSQAGANETMETPPISEDFFKIDGVDDLPTVSLADIPAADITADILSTEVPAVLDSLEQPEPEPEAVEEPDPMQAFAKLAFPDGDFYVHTYAVELGRDINAHKHERKLGKQRKRRERNERKEMAERRRRQMEDEADALSPGDLGAYPAPPMSVSNVSEVGGIMGIDMYSSDDASRTSRRPRKKSFRSSNSDHSLDPNTLHANPQDLLWHNEAVTPPRGLPEGLPDHAYQCPLIPIHPQAGASFKGISRRHVRIEYNLEHGYWEMFVTGRNTVFHDNDRIETGESARLHHGSEIIIQTITIIFKLPDNARNDDEDVLQEMSDSDSPLSDISDQEMLSSGDEPLRSKRRAASPPKKKVIKLKLGKPKDKTVKTDPDTTKDRSDRPDKSSKSLKHSSKAPKTEKHDKAEKTPKKDRPDVASKSKKSDKTEKAENAEKPEAVEASHPSSSKEIPTPVAITPTIPVMPPPPPSQPMADVQQTIEPDDAAMAAALQAAEPAPSEASPAIPAELPPGSVLLGVAPEDIPAKRKGPGRPPKNGVMSKRDEAIIKRLTKDLQKQGKIVPPLNELLAMARAEGSTKKDKEDKYDGEGKLILEGSTTPGPSMAIDPSIMQSVEGGSGTTPQMANQATPDKDAKPKRIVRTPSPQKPESEYTEEELKKPTQTYVVLIHEALSKSNTGIMDLQQIYDAMQKMYPFFKYRAGTSGWQSSVRHNLISSEAFQEAGKIGKGRLWKINPDVSIDKEKKRKAPTPPPQNAPQYPYYPNQQYPYGAPPPGNQAYPYARPSPYGTPYGPPSGQAGSRPPVPAPQQKPGTYYSPYASNPVGGAHASPYGPPSRPPYAPYPSQNQGQPGAPGQQPTPSPYGPPQQQSQQSGQPTQQGQPQTQGNGQPSSQPPYQQQSNGQHPPQQNGQHPQGHPPQNGQPPQGPPQQSQGSQPSRPYAPSQSHGPPQSHTAPSTTSAPTPQPGGIDITRALTEIMSFQAQYLGRHAPGPETENARAMFTRAMTTAISGPVANAPKPSPAELALTETIAGIYARSRVDPISTAPPVQSGPIAVQQTGSQQTNAQSSSGPAATGAPRTSNTTQQSMNTTPAPPQGNIPARYLPPQYNPQANSTATPPQQQGQRPPQQTVPPQQQGQRPPQQQPLPQQQGQRSVQQPPSQGQPRPTSSSDVHLANALRNFGASPSPAPGTPARGSVGPPQPHGAYSPAAQNGRPMQNGQPQAPAPGQSRPQPSGTTVNGINAVPGSNAQPQISSSARANPVPSPAPNMQQPPRPVFTPPVSAQQGNMVPPRPTFAPSPGQQSNPAAASPAMPAAPVPSTTNAPAPPVANASAQAPVAPAVTTPTPQQAPVQQQPANGSSVKRPIEIDEEDDGAEAKKVKT